MEASPLFWILFNAGVLGLLLLDLGVFARKDASGAPAPVPVRTALIKSAAYVGLAVLFCHNLLDCRSGRVIRSLRGGSILLILLGFLFVLNQGYWDEMMQSLTLVLAACLVCMAVGVPVGIAAAHRPGFMPGCGRCWI